MGDVTAHEDWPALVARMRENPDDDLPRLVAADWLEEHGAREWARFVRWGNGIQLVNLVINEHQRVVFGPRWTGHGQQQPKGTTAALRAVLPLPDATRCCEAFFVRGFLTELEVPADWWLAHGDAVYARQPVTAVRLTTAPQPALEARWRGWLWKDYGPQGIPRDRLAALADEYERGMAETSYDKFCLSKLWPGVTFTLPAFDESRHPRMMTTGQFAAYTHNEARAMLGLPPVS